MKIFEKLKKIDALIHEAAKIMDSCVDWEVKYDTIFGMNIWQTIRAAGYNIEWYDPDTSYEEDVTAYFNALKRFQSDFTSIKFAQKVSEVETQEILVEIFNFINDLAIQDNFNQIEDFLQNVKESASIDVLLAILMATFSLPRDRIPARQRIFNIAVQDLNFKNFLQTLR